MRLRRLRVLPMLHSNGYKMANPTVLGRLGDEELTQLFTGYRYKPYFVEGDDPEAIQQLMAATVDAVIAEIHAIQDDARSKRSGTLPVWPLIVLRSPKGWTGPKFVDGKPVEGTWRAHQVPVADLETQPEHLKILEDWMKSYRPQELFDESGRLIRELAALAPEGDRRMGANPHANGGLLLRDLVMPDFREYAVAVHKPGTGVTASTRVGSFSSGRGRGGPRSAIGASRGTSSSAWGTNWWNTGSTFTSTATICRK
jgi:xylulose-5-phosphate/fructose-6-phosphate phosphoketolase